MASEAIGRGFESLQARQFRRDTPTPLPSPVSSPAGSLVPDAVLRAAHDALEKRFGIHHATLQLESADFASHCIEVAPPY